MAKKKVTKEEPKVTIKPSPPPVRRFPEVHYIKRISAEDLEKDVNTWIRDNMNTEVKNIKTISVDGGLLVEIVHVPND